MSSRKNEAHSDVKEEKPSASDIEPLELAEGDKTFPRTSLTLEGHCDPEHFRKEEKEMENNTVGDNSENNTVQDDLDVCLSDCVEKELPLEKKEEKGEKPEKNAETEMDEVDVTTTEETVCLRTGGFEEHSDNNVLRFQTEVEISGKIYMEPQSTKSSNTAEPSSSAFDASGKPELLNFLGDWPVEQTMGQRVKRARRLEKSSLKSTKEGETPSQQHPELGEEQAGLPGTCTVEKGHEEENLAFSCSSGNSDKIAPELQMIGHWPVSGSLEQRQQRSRRVRKPSLNQSEGRNTEGNIIRNGLETVDVLRGTPVNTAEQLNTKNIHMQQPETVISETVGEKKFQQNKRMRKHHKLALTFTNNNFPHPREEQHLSMLNAAEEKQNAYSCRQRSSHSQTESQDFAVLWRLEKKMLFPETTKVLHGRLDGFKPKDIDSASDPQEKIPYRVMYDKSTFVEESELINIDESEKLNMLCKLFESVSFEALKDLYERCNKDIDWATGLLLDSDEKLCKDVDIECFQVREADPVVADLVFQANTNCGENLKDSEQMPQITGAGDLSEPLEDKNSSLSIAESTATKATVTDADVSDSVTVTSLNDLAELKKDAAPRSDTGSSAAGILEPSVSGKQDIESESPVEETVNKPLVSQPDAGFCMPVTFPHSPNTTFTNLKFESNNKSESNPSETNAENSKVTASLLEMDHSHRSDKELERDKETQGSSREFHGEEEIEAPSWNETKAKIQSPKPTSHAAFSIDCLELTLPPELALQLKEIFGPVGIDAGMGIIISIFL